MAKDNEENERWWEDVWEMSNDELAEELTRPTVRNRDMTVLRVAVSRILVWIENEKERREDIPKKEIRI